MAKQEFRVALTAAIPFSMEASGLLAGIGQILAKAQDEIQKKHGVEMQLTQSVVTLRAPKGAARADVARLLQGVKSADPEPTDAERMAAAMAAEDRPQTFEADKAAAQDFLTGGPGQGPSPEPEPAALPATPTINTAAPPPKSFAEMAAEAKAKREAGQAAG